MEKEADEEEKKKKKKPGGNFKISDNLLFHIFGLRNSNLYNNIKIKQNQTKNNNSNYFSNSFTSSFSNSKILNTNSLIFKETRDYFIKKENGLKNFVDKFLENRQNIYSILPTSVDLAQIFEILQPEGQMNINNTFYLYNKRKTKKLSNECLCLCDSSRFILYKNEEIFRFKTEYAQKIQKNVKGFLARMKFYKLFNSILRERTINNVILIQSVIRKFITIKNLKMKLIFENIIFTRKENSLKIIFLIKKFFNSLFLRKRIIKKMILSLRREKLVKIQKNLRMYQTRKQVKQILMQEANNYMLTYPFKCKKARLIVYINAPSKIDYIMENVYDFKYSQLLDMHVLYINPVDFKCGKYRVKLIIDGQVTCDGRFPHLEFSDGYYYNIINFYLKRQVKSSSSIKYSELIATNPESIPSESYNSRSDSYLRALRKQNLTEVDMELKANLENKEAKSYTEILKILVDNEADSGYSGDDYFETNFD